MNKKLKILLVRPHAELATSRWLQSILLLEPYAQEVIAGAVQPPHEVRICDLAVEKKPLAAFQRTLETFRPDLVGFGGFSSQYRANLRLAALCRQILPHALTCLGGIQPSSSPKDCKDPDSFDFIVRGDGASALRTIIQALENNNPIPESDWILPTDSDNFDLLAAQPPPPLFNSLTIKPRRDLVDMSKYRCLVYGRTGEKLTTIFPQVACIRTSAGCPNRCEFCTVHYLANGKYLQRDPEDVVEEIAGIPQKYIYFVDDETFINAKRMRRIAELLLERNIKKRYLSWARSDTICKNPELFELWQKAGLEMVYIGFESLQDTNLSDYNKNATPAQNRQARQIMRDLGLNVHAAFMVNPDFTAEDFKIVQRAIREMAPAEFAFTVYSPPPGTPAFEQSRHQFICPDPFYFYDCLHTILPARLPLKKFYRYLTILYGLGAARMPARVNKVKAPLRDRLKYLAQGARAGWHILHLYRHYDRQYW